MWTENMTYNFKMIHQTIQQYYSYKNSTHSLYICTYSTYNPIFHFKEDFKVLQKHDIATKSSKTLYELYVLRLFPEYTIEYLKSVVLHVAWLVKYLINLDSFLTFFGLKVNNESSQLYFNTFQKTKRALKIKNTVFLHLSATHCKFIETYGSGKMYLFKKTVQICKKRCTTAFIKKSSDSRFPYKISNWSFSYSVQLFSTCLENSQVWL